MYVGFGLTGHQISTTLHKIVDHSIFGLDEDPNQPTFTANFENYHLGRLGRRSLPLGRPATAELSRYNPPVE